MTLRASGFRCYCENKQIDFKLNFLRLVKKRLFNNKVSIKEAAEVVKNIIRLKGKIIKKGKNAI